MAGAAKEARLLSSGKATRMVDHIGSRGKRAQGAPRWQEVDRRLRPDLLMTSLSSGPKATGRQIPSRKGPLRGARVMVGQRNNRRDPVEIIEDSSRGRLPELLPIRYGRMLRSPFTFLRGSAALMAYDLASTPITGVQVQACGDCHLLNFGLFATPERNLIFDIKDFDETLRAPWEWDLKRLATSFVVAGRSNGISDRCLRDVVATCGTRTESTCASSPR